MQYKKEKNNDNFPIFFLKFQVVFVDTIIFQALRFSSPEKALSSCFRKEF